MRAGLLLVAFVLASTGCPDRDGCWCNPQGLLPCGFDVNDLQVLMAFRCVPEKNESVRAYLLAGARQHAFGGCEYPSCTRDFWHEEWSWHGVMAEVIVDFEDLDGEESVIDIYQSPRDGVALELLVSMRPAVNQPAIRGPFVGTLQAGGSSNDSSLGWACQDFTVSREIPQISRIIIPSAENSNNQVGCPVDADAGHIEEAGQ